MQDEQVVMRDNSTWLIWNYGFQRVGLDYEVQEGETLVDEVPQWLVDKISELYPGV